MDEATVFCETCRSDTAYTVSELKMEGTVKGERHQYIGKEARCNKCGSIVHAAEIHRSNLHALHDAYREKHGIVSLEAIRAIPGKYAIGKRPLSLLLGWGEQTFSRYFEGSIPTRQYSDVLQKIYDDPLYYLDLLERNAANLKAVSSYEKSKKAVAVLLDANQAAESKIDLVIRYLLNQCEDMTPLALQKALYYVQGFYYAFYDAFIFDADCEAWAYGPVYREAYSRYKDYRFDPLKSKEEFDDSIFSTAEKTIIDSVIKHICCYNGKILKCFTYNETPWLETCDTLPANAMTNRKIKKEVIGSYFAAIKHKYNMINPNDISAYAQDMFSHI